jgi:hypothetical protein
VAGEVQRGGRLIKFQWVNDALGPPLPLYGAYGASLWRGNGLGASDRVFGGAGWKGPLVRVTVAIYMSGTPKTVGGRFGGHDWRCSYIFRPLPLKFFATS